MTAIAPLMSQYCLKWNNHKDSVFSILDRLRNDESFVDVTLSSADRKTIKCHRLVLSAGSSYLEDILAQNKSDHPTVILSQINHAELKLLIDFMYSGEINVDQQDLHKLLEAAKILKIRGLSESVSEAHRDDSEEECELPTEDRPDASLTLQSDVKFVLPSVLPELHSSQLKEKIVGSQKRKRSLKSDSSSSDSKKKFVHVGKTLPNLPISQPKAFSPLFGVSNAYFLHPPPLKTILENANSIPKILTDDLKSSSCSPPSSPAMSEDRGDIPNLISQSSIPQILLPSLSTPDLPLLIGPNRDAETNGKNHHSSSPGLVNLTPVRRYKQYTELMLHQALKEISEGQSINKSSMKYNIPARTLRDWMKRMNIKSVFTHHGTQEDRSGNSDDSCDSKSLHQSNGTAFPGMSSSQSSDGSKSGQTDDEEEIDDDEEKILSVPA